MKLSDNRARLIFFLNLFDTYNGQLKISVQILVEYKLKFIH